MITISLCMIVKNEEEMLADCLNSVKSVCDEIIIVDTGSEDRTKEIARQFTDRVFDFQWIDDFAAARNYSFRQATMDYILWLDADDILLEADQQKLRALKKKLDRSVDVVSMIYNIAFDNDGNPTFSYRRNRLTKRERNFQWIGPVHEYLNVSGHALHSDIAVTHRKREKNGRSEPSKRNLLIFEKHRKRGEKLLPRDLF